MRVGRLAHVSHVVEARTVATEGYDRLEGTLKLESSTHENHERQRLLLDIVVSLELISYIHFLPFSTDCTDGPRQSEIPAPNFSFRTNGRQF
jgi:hypothetical protein